MAQSVTTAPAFEDDDSFEKQIDHWVEQDLAPASRTAQAFPPMVAEAAPVGVRRGKDGRCQDAQRRHGPSRPTGRESLRSETYMQRLWRKWAKRAAIAVGVFVAVLVTWWRSRWFDLTGPRPCYR